MARGWRKVFVTALLVTVVFSVLGAQFCLAADEGAAAGKKMPQLSDKVFSDRGAVGLAAAFVVGFSCIAAAFAVARVGAAALGAASERPELLMRSLIFVALAEGIAVLGLIMGILLWTLITPV